MARVGVAVSCSEDQSRAAARPGTLGVLLRHPRKGVDAGMSSPRFSSVEDYLMEELVRARLAELDWLRAAGRT